MDDRFFDIAIVVPLVEEAEILFETFKPIISAPHDGVMCTEVDAECGDLKVIVAQCTDQGPNEARRACEALFRNFDVGMVVCIGIAGRISNDLLLGDVCYTGVILDVSEGQKIIDLRGSKKSKGIEILLSPESFSTSTALQSSITFSRTDQTLKKPVYENWQADCGAKLEAALQKAQFDDNTKKMFREYPNCQHGKLVCGPVSASKTFISRLQELDRKLLAIETESGAIFKACAEHRSTPVVTIRGISDFADAQKNMLETTTRGLAREIAARNAVTFFKSQFSNHHFTKFLAERRRELTGGSTLDLFAAEHTGSSGVVANTLSFAVAEAEAELRSLSPEYRLQPKGYVLPSPRLSPMKFQGDPRAEDEAEYYEIQEVLNGNNIALVDIPLNYPDEGLPWVLANSLCGAVIQEKQALPFVIDGENISAPTDLAKLVSNVELNALLADCSAQVVFIVHNFDFRSRSRSAFLMRQIEKYSAAKFVFVTRGEGKLVFSLDTVQKVGAKPFRVRGVPFLAIANFIRANFNFEPLESEVIAYRIQSAFDRFDLLAHPTYFAGIPEETLIALLQANRRSELIQLAVDGFLTFLVAEDKSVPLSRTTRSRFLSELAVELEVYKRTFSRLELIEFTDAFFERYDFEGDSNQFIGRFLEKGILRVEDGRVEFSLPFVRTYLLAVALSKDEMLAKRHFSFSEDEFDYETFDLYAELGAAQDIVDEILRRLSVNLEQVPSNVLPPGVLLTGELKPALMTKLTAVERLRRAVQKSIKTLAKHAEDSKRKQQILDVANTTAKQASRAKPSEAVSDGGVDQRSPVNVARRDWQIGCVLLGAAAEQLIARKKLELIGLLTRTASRLIDAQTRAYAKVDFAELKRKVLASEQVERLLATFTEDRERDDIRRLLSNIIDLLELALLAEPFVSTVSFLSEQARHKILAPSIEKAEFSAAQEEVIRDTWLADVDPQRGRTNLRKTVASLPAAPFFRLVLATHLFGRVYWVHWNPDDRMELLNAANDAIKALGLSFIETATVKRKIERKKIIQRKKGK